MIKKICILFIISNFINNCGFTPLHLAIKNDKFSIEKIEYKGDKIINNFFKTYFKTYENNKNEKKYIVKVNTNYNKNVLSKDKTAKIVNYQLISEVSFEVFLKDKIVKKVKFTEKQNMNNITDKLDEQQFERVIKQNFASTIFNNFITQILLIDDN